MINNIITKTFKKYRDEFLEDPQYGFELLKRELLSQGIKLKINSTNDQNINIANKLFFIFAPLSLKTKYIDLLKSNIKNIKMKLSKIEKTQSKKEYEFKIIMPNICRNLVGDFHYLLYKMFDPNIIIVNDVNTNNKQYNSFSRYTEYLTIKAENETYPPQYYEQIIKGLLSAVIERQIMFAKKEYYVCNINNLLYIVNYKADFNCLQLNINNLDSTNNYIYSVILSTIQFRFQKEIYFNTHWTDLICDIHYIIEIDIPLQDIISKINKKINNKINQYAINIFYNILFESYNKFVSPSKKSEISFTNLWKNMQGYKNYVLRYQDKQISQSLLLKSMLLMKQDNIILKHKIKIEKVTGSFFVYKNIDRSKDFKYNIQNIDKIIKRAIFDLVRNDTNLFALIISELNYADKILFNSIHK